MTPPAVTLPTVQTKSSPAALPVPVRSRDSSGVDVRVEYCEPSNYAAVAERLAREIYGDLAVVPHRVAGRGGVFEVWVDQRLIFSKRASRRLPDADEILFHVRAAKKARQARAEAAASRN